jgi:hypothetical protein
MRDPKGRAGTRPPVPDEGQPYTCDWSLHMARNNWSMSPTVQPSPSAMDAMLADQFQQDFDEMNVRFNLPPLSVPMRGTIRP